MADQSCDVTLFAYHLHTPTAAHVTTRLLSEAGSDARLSALGRGPRGPDGCRE